MKKLFLSLSVLALLTATSCNKNKDDKFTPTKENLTGTYNITSATYQEGNSPAVNVFSNTDPSMNWYEPCERDDEYKLNGDSSFELVDAGTKCTPEGGDSGTWSLVNSTTINIDGSDMTIASFDGKQLVLKYTDSGDTYTTTLVKK